jgi:SAM-dependent MidA family methyltransferase
MDVLDYIRDEYPEVYDRTQYNIIEISEKLVNIQKKKLEPAHSCVNVVRRSIFHWTTREPAPCFFVAMEVVVNCFLPASMPL